MKLLIAYDGSKDAEAAIDDLRSCGLPVAGLAEVISVAEVWLPPPSVGSNLEQPPQPPSFMDEVIHDWNKKAEKAVGEAKMLTGFAAGRVKAALPAWDVSSRASYGSPGWEIVSEAEKLNADLILVGAQGHSFLSRLVLGSISQRVLTEAHCSVRVGRGTIDLDSGPERILIGFDGSRGAEAAVDAVVARDWSDGTEVRLLAVVEPVVPTAIGRFVTPVARIANEINTSEHAWLETVAKDAISKLQEKGLSATIRIEPGNPKHVIPDEAEKWGADSIFVGANAWGGRFERFLIGSTSAAVAARAHCSVEVVRVTLSRTFLEKQSRESGEIPGFPGPFSAGERR